MNDELYKRLKDTGFPTTHHEGECKRNDCYEPSLCQSVPTLEELIEACGDNYFSMESDSGLIDQTKKWYAEDRQARLNGFGSTPTEAVARLWLALNKKKI